MKEMFESEETFNAHERILVGYCRLTDLRNEGMAPLSTIVAEVDAECGRDRKLEHINESICILKDIIEAKKVIESDYSKEEQMLLNLQKLIKDETNN